ncbi:hypothetical protein KVT40_003209 [Elsinoe batatas]|uniref:Uncharacterized protein n=1 Tax=Elsinoe batatas TaxID=2601811 RepID=A0A8K0L442_9PEZI|nr:hypothetical protein KVT40_003209 [Elsinoe batatas]
MILHAILTTIMSSRSVSCCINGQDEYDIPVVDPSTSKIDCPSERICRSLRSRARLLRRAHRLLAATQACPPFYAPSAKVKSLLVCSVQPHHTTHEALQILQADTERAMIVVDYLAAMVYKNIDNELVLMRAGVQAAPRTFRSRPRILLHAYHQTSCTLFHPSLGLISQSGIQPTAKPATSVLSYSWTLPETIDGASHADRSSGSDSPWIPLHRDIRSVLRMIAKDAPTYFHDDEQNEWRVAVVSVGMMQRLDVSYGRSDRLLRWTGKYGLTKLHPLVVKQVLDSRYQALEWIPRQCMVTISGEDFREVCDELGISADIGVPRLAELLMAKLPASFPV